MVAKIRAFMNRVEPGHSDEKVAARPNEASYVRSGNPRPVDVFDDRVRDYQIVGSGICRKIH